MINICSKSTVRDKSALDYRSSLEDTVKVDLLKRNYPMPPYPHYTPLGGYFASTFINYFNLFVKDLKKLILAHTAIISLNWGTSTTDTPKVTQRAVIPHYRRF